MKLTLLFDFRGWFRGWFKRRHKIKGNDNALNSVLAHSNNETTNAVHDPDASYWKGRSEALLDVIELMAKEKRKKSKS